MGNNKPPYKIALGVLLLLVVVLLSGSQIAAALESASFTGDESQSINQLSDEQVENYITAAKNARASEETLCDLSLDLAGGSISNLSAQGWVQGTESDTWTKQFNKGEQLSLATPVRHGFSFVGWDSNGDNSVDIQPGGRNIPCPMKTRRHLPPSGNARTSRSRLSLTARPSIPSKFLTSLRSGATRHKHRGRVPSFLLMAPRR